MQGDKERKGTWGKDISDKKMVQVRESEKECKKTHLKIWQKNVSWLSYVWATVSIMIGMDRCFSPSWNQIWVIYHAVTDRQEILTHKFIATEIWNCKVRGKKKTKKQNTTKNVRFMPNVNIKSCNLHFSMTCNNIQTYLIDCCFLGGFFTCFDCWGISCNFFEVFCAATAQML